MAGGCKERTGGPLGVPGRTARDARRGWTPRLGGHAWLRGTSLGKARGGSDVEAAYGARAGALWRAGARATSRRHEIVSDWPCSSEISPKI
jgi:hypothetical protein